MSCSAYRPTRRASGYRRARARTGWRDRRDGHQRSASPRPSSAASPGRGRRRRLRFSVGVCRCFSRGSRQAALDPAEDAARLINSGCGAHGDLILDLFVDRAKCSVCGKRPSERCCSRKGALALPVRFFDAVSMPTECFPISPHRRGKCQERNSGLPVRADRMQMRALLAKCLIFIALTPPNHLVNSNNRTTRFVARLISEIEILGP